MLFRERRPAFSRAEVSRARVVGFALAPLLARCRAAAPALSVVPGAAV